MKNMKNTHRRAKTIAFEAAKASLCTIIENEDTITAVVSDRFQNYKFIPIGHEEAIKAMLTLNERFEEMNPGGKCWYFARIWKLIMMLDRPSSRASYQDMLVKKVAEYMREN